MYFFHQSEWVVHCADSILVFTWKHTAEQVSFKFVLIAVNESAGCGVVLTQLAVGILQAQQMTGVAVPSYYNPAAVNPLKYAEQLKKRKMLWSKAPKETADKEKEVQLSHLP